MTNKQKPLFLNDTVIFVDNEHFAKMVQMEAFFDCALPIVTEKDLVLTPIRTSVHKVERLDYIV